MSRVTRGVTSHRKHQKVLALTRGHKGGRSKLIRQAKESLLHAGRYAFAGRRQRKRDMRSLWITQMGIALKNEQTTYSKFINDMKLKGVLINRKMLAEMAVKDLPTFKKIVSEVSSK